MDKTTNSKQDWICTVPARPLSFWLRLAHVSTVLRDEKIKKARLRKISDFELVLIVSGKAWIGFPDGQSVSLSSGDLVFIPPNFPHAWAGEKGSHLAVHFDLHAKPNLIPHDNIQYLPNYVSRNDSGQIPLIRIVSAKQNNLPKEKMSFAVSEDFTVPFVSKVKSPAVWEDRLERLVQWYSRRTHRTTSAQIEIIETLSWALKTLVKENVDFNKAENADIAKILPLLENPSEAVPTIPELAARAGMSLTAFRLAFRKTTGMSPRDYQEQCRIDRAAQTLLETDRRVNEIALAEGYDDPYHFSRVFKKITGYSPKRFRTVKRG